MKFKLIKAHTYPWPVTVLIPSTDKPGDVVEQEFVATFAAIPKSELEALDAEIAALPFEQQQARKDDHLKRVLVGWDEGVVDDDDKPVPFSPRALQQACEFPWFGVGCYRAYFESHRGARRGN